jgi:nucleotide sugar dehydrogenase
LSFCPERTVEGKAFEELSNLPQIISGTTDEAIKEAKKLFSIFCNKILVATSTRIAELAKLSSNIERDVYFSFANELGLISRELKLNYSELKLLVTTDYPRSFLKEVGPVAGPCLEKDTYILKQSFKNNFKMELIETARSLNENWIYKIISEILSLYPSASKICLTGLAFKGNPSTDDLRGSLAIPMFHYMISRGINVFLFDPTIDRDNILNHFGDVNINILNSWSEVEENCDLIILQNGSTLIFNNCSSLNIKLLDITSFNNTIAKENQNLF